MEPVNIRFGGGATESILHPLVAVALIAAIVATVWLPRQRAGVWWLCTVLLVPFGQVVVIGGVHFTVYRILIIFGLARIGLSKPRPGAYRFAGGFNAIDRAFTLFAIYSFAAFILQWMEPQALIKGLGSLLDAVGGYYVLRFFIADREDVLRMVRALAVISCVVAASMIGEQATRRNVFGLLGGVAYDVPVRDGKIRSMGAFQVYITAGVFGATLLPLAIWLLSATKSKVFAVIGVCGATAMTVASNSSTPLLALAGGIVGLCFWPLRRHMRAFRWALGLVLLGVHVSMKAPVWALIARVDLTGSSSGFHRYMLVDQCIRHFTKWWLIGTKDYNAWGFDMWDLSNQYVSAAVTGGLVPLVAFILVISRSFASLGRSRKRAAKELQEQWFYWCLGSALLAHVVAYFGISYFDQVQAVWYALIGMISAIEAEKATACSRALVAAYSNPKQLSNGEWACA